jgi:hypothetical protein
MKMRKKAFVIVTIFGLLLITWLPCQADDIYGCAKKKNGQLRIVSDHSKCLKSEYPITLYGTALKNPLSNFAGELCWLLNKTEDEHGPKVERPFLMKLWVTYRGDTYFTIQGIVEAPGYMALHLTARVNFS